MKRGWKRFWLCASSLALLPALVASPQSHVKKRANELTLAGLRPGRSKIAQAETDFVSLERRQPADGVFEWSDVCNGRILHAEADDARVVQVVTVTTLVLTSKSDCSGQGELKSRKLWSAGRGLALGNSRQNVLQLYGQPDSRSPSIRGSRELELYFYSFDWAGSDVPQVMEVYCDRVTGRVVEITLAFPSL